LTVLILVSDLSVSAPADGAGLAPEVYPVASWATNDHYPHLRLLRTRKTAGVSYKHLWKLAEGVLAAWAWSW
jgi:hypothetical protein